MSERETLWLLSARDSELKTGEKAGETFLSGCCSSTKITPTPQQNSAITLCAFILLAILESDTDV